MSKPCELSEDCPHGIPILITLRERETWGTLEVRSSRSAVSWAIETKSIRLFVEQSIRNKIEGEEEEEEG